MSNTDFVDALNEYWRVDNKHGLYPQRESFNVKIKYSGVIYFSITLVMLAIAIIFTTGAL